jgi:hypothetical protein
MSRNHSRSPRSPSATITPGDPGPSSLSSILSPHKRKRSKSRDDTSEITPTARRARSASSEDEDTPRLGDDTREMERDELESDNGSTPSPGGGGW